jgi:hypothetical protein
MKSFVVLLLLTSNHCWVHCFLINYQNDTERFRRNTDGNTMERVMFGTYNEYVESKSAEKRFSLYDLFQEAISSALLSRSVFVA